MVHEDRGFHEAGAFISESLHKERPDSIGFRVHSGPLWACLGFIHCVWALWFRMGFLI